MTDELANVIDVWKHPVEDAVADHVPDVPRRLLASRLYFFFFLQPGAASRPTPCRIMVRPSQVASYLAQNIITLILLCKLHEL